MNPTHVNHMDIFQEICRTKDLRVTHQRLEIYKELAEAKDHPSAETLHHRLLLRMPTLSLDTVYRTLTTFISYNLINKVETVESQARFEVQHIRHHHLICRECNHIFDFQWHLLDQATLPDEIGRFGQFEQPNVVVYGTCEKCIKGD